MKKIIFTLSILVSFICCAQNLSKLHAPNCDSSYERKTSVVTEFTSSEEENYSINIFEGILSESELEDKHIYIHHTALKDINDLNGIKRNLTDFNNSVNLRELGSENCVSIISQKNNDEELILVLHNVNNKVIGFLHKINSQYSNKNIIENVFSNTNENNVKKIIWYGDDLATQDIYQIASSNKLQVLRRSKYVDIPLNKNALSKNLIEQKSISSSNSMLFNAVPANESNLIHAGKSIANLQEWEKFKNQIDITTKNKFEKSIASLDVFKNELINGKSDLVLLVAHSDRLNLYFNGEKISMSEMLTWEKSKVKRDKPRVAVLLSCRTGEIQKENKSWFFFNKQRLSLTEVLIQNRYFDQVISPNKEISLEEATSVLESIIHTSTVQNLYNLFPAWHLYVKLYTNFLNFKGNT